MNNPISKNLLPFEGNRLKSESSGSLPEVFLEIQRGRTAFPYRPVLGNRFLIGSASCCDLCLGGKSIPQLHSILHLDGSNVILEVIDESPPLKINGETRQSITLHDGDVIEIGRFQVVARISHTPDAPQSEQLDGSQVKNVYEILEPAEESDHHEEECEDLEQFSSEELVDLIETQQQMVEEFEERRQAGAGALIQAVQNRTETLEEQPENTIHSEEDQPTVSLVEENIIDSTLEEDILSEEVQLRVHSEVEDVLEHLHGISDELDRRFERISRRESEFAEAAAGLLDAQYKLATQLEMLVLRLGSLNSDHSEDENLRRAVA